MKIATEENPFAYVGSGNFKEMSFGIKEEDISHIIQMLRQQLYQYPIESICREVASNARDANREVGKGGVPIEITISNNPFLETSKSITFEDCGPGISPDRMADVFLNYGSSTKRGTNTQTGGFGLGAKTPFAYSNVFNIDTVCNGKRYVYLAGVAKGNRGQMILLHSENTKEPSGTKISIPLQEKDIIDFEKACLKYTALWDVKPITNNFSMASEVSYNIIYEDTAVKVISVKPRLRILTDNNLGVSIDGIPYPLNCFDDDMKPIQKSITEYLDRRPYGSIDEVRYMFLKFDVGDISITPNRENLHFDDKTKKKILGSMTSFKSGIKPKLEELSRKIPKKIDQLECLQSNIAGKHGLPIEEGIEFTRIVSLAVSFFGYEAILGKKLTEEYKLLSIKCIGISPSKLNLSGVTISYSYNAFYPRDINALISDGKKVYFSDTGRLSPKKAAYLHKVEGINDLCVICKKTPEKGATPEYLKSLKFDLKNTLNRLGLKAPEVKGVSTIPSNKSDRKIKRGIDISVQGVVMDPKTGKSYNVESVDWDTVNRIAYVGDVSFPAGLVYKVYTERLTREHTKKALRESLDLNKYMKLHNKMNPFLFIYINRSGFEKVKGTAKVNSLLAIPDELKEEINLLRMSEQVRYSFVYKFYKNCRPERDIHERMRRKIFGLCRIKSNVSQMARDFKECHHYFEYREGVNYELSMIRDMIYKDYPMLSYTSVHCFKSDEKVKNYIKLVDNQFRRQYERD